MRTRALVLVLTGVATLVVALAAPAGATGPPDWASADSATVHPGVQTRTEGAQCTANFVFYDAASDASTSEVDIYIGQAAHCSGTDGNTATNGCEAGTRPEGTMVDIDGASQPGTIVYSSWVEMQENGESDGDTCAHNDFALVKLDPADHDSVNPSIPHWGGPTGVTTTTEAQDKVYSYGNSSLRFGIEETSPKEGYSLGEDSAGWNHQVYTLTPGVPGDSGSAFIDEEGRAFGVLSTVQLAPLAASNGVSDVAQALEYMESRTGLDVTLAVGTEPFVPGPLPE